MTTQTYALVPIGEVSEATATTPLTETVSYPPERRSLRVTATFPVTVVNEAIWASIKLGPVTTPLTPHDKPDAGRSRVAKRYRRTQRRLPRPLSARRVVSSIARGSPVVRRKAVTG
jgi:hypothetical protein